MKVGLKRILLILFSILGQIAIIVFVFMFFPNIKHLLLLIFPIMSILVVRSIFRLNISPDYKLTWVLVIFISPILGSVIFLLSKRNLFKKYNANLSESYRITGLIDDDYNDFINEHGNFEKQVFYLKNSAHANVFRSNATNYYSLGEELWKDLLDDLEKAENFIFMEYFIIGDGIMLRSIVDILKKKASEGVKVKFIFDGFGSILTAPNNFVKDLNDCGVECISFNKKIRIFNYGFNNRDHRKITVIDGKVAYTGGINLSDEYINKKVRFGHWKDTGIRIEGKGVDEFTNMFLTLWGICKSEIPNYKEFINVKDIDKSENTEAYIAPYTDYPSDGETVGALMYEEMINSSKEYVYVTSPYMILDYNMLSNFMTAAKLGVDVRIVLPAISDNKLVHMLTRSFYQPLIEAGVRIFEYTPGFIHSKQFVSDDEKAIIGTINLDYRSLVHHIENAVWLYKTNSVMDIKTDFLKVQAVSKEILIDDISQKRLIELLLLPILRAFAPLF